MDPIGTPRSVARPPSGQRGSRSCRAGGVLLVLLAVVLALAGSAAATPTGPNPATAWASWEPPGEPPEKPPGREPPAGLAKIVLEPTPEPFGVGLATAFRVRGLDGEQRDLGDVTPWTMFTIDNAECPERRCTTDQPGRRLITARTLQKFSVEEYRTAVKVGRLELRPAEDWIEAGGWRPYTVHAFAAEAIEGTDDLGDVTDQTTFAGAPSLPCDRPRAEPEPKPGCGFRKAGNYTVIGEIKRADAAGTAALEVRQGPQGSLELRPRTSTVTAGASQTYQAIGKDQFDNESDVTGRTTFTVDRAGASCIGPTCTAETPGTYTVTGTLGEALRGTATLVGQPPTLTSLRLSPQSSSVVAGASVQYVAHGLDDNGNDQGDVTRQTVLTIEGKGTCDGSSCRASEPGTYLVTGRLVGNPKVSGTATLTVEQPVAVAVRLDPRRSTIVAGASKTYRAIAVDALRRELGDVTERTTFSIEATSPTGRDGSCLGPSCGARTAGSYRVTGRAVGIQDAGQARLDVVPGGLAEVALQPSSASIVAGATQPYRLWGFDAQRNSLGELTGRASFSIEAGGSCSAARCTADKVGTYLVTGRVLNPTTGAAVTDDAELRVDPGPLAAVRLDPSIATIIAGATQPYTVRGYDALGNDRGEVTARTAFSIGPGGSCAGASCTAYATGSYPVTGTVTGADVVGGAAGGRAQLLVEPARLARVVLDPHTATVAAGATQTYTASGYDAFGNDLGDVTGRTTFRIAPDGSCRAATCAGAKPRTYAVTGAVAGEGADRPITDTARLTVQRARVARLELDPPQRTIIAGASQGYRARGYDAASNSLGDVTGRTVFTIDGAGSCARSTCTADQPGAHAVTGTDVESGATGTARLLVLRALRGRPSEGNDEQVTQLVLSPAAASVAMGAVQAYTARGVDARGRDRGEVSAQTVFSIEPDGSCAGARCRASTPGIHRVTGVLSGADVRAQARLEVRTAPIVRVLLDPAVGSVGVGGLQTYRARGLDAVGNELGDVTDRTALSISRGGSCAARTCTADRPGSYTVTGRVPGAPIATAMLRVTPTKLAKLMLEPTVTSISPGASQSYRAWGLDVDGNDLGEMTAGTTFTMAPAGSCTAASCTVRDPGDYTVTGMTRGTTVSTTVPLRVVSPVRSRTVSQLLSDGLPWMLLLAGALLLFSGGALALAGIPSLPKRWIRRPGSPSSGPGQHGPDWVRQHVRAESRSGPALTRVRDDPRTPQSAVRLESYPDHTGTQTVKESAPWS